MIRIALCSEDSACQKKIAQLIAACNQQGRTAEPLLADTYHSLQALVDNVEDGDLYDVFLLDLEHPDAREFRLARRLREKLGRAVVLVVTSCGSLPFTAESAQLKVSRYIDAGHWILHCQRRFPMQPWRWKPNCPTICW